MSARLVAVAALLLAVAPHAATAQESAGLREWLHPRATLRTMAWSSTRRMDSRGVRAGSALWMDVAPRLSPRLDVRVAGWVGNGDALGLSEVDAALRELYLDIDAGVAELRLGKQIIAWGRTDALNPTDNLSPRDFTLLVPDDNDQKWGVPAARLSVPLGGTMVVAYWLADFHGNGYPSPSLPPGVALKERRTARPADQGAIRIERSGGAVDWSLSYFRGLDLMPDIRWRFEDDMPTVELSHRRIEVLGADVASTVGRLGVRGEGAWNRTEDRDGSDVGVKNSSLYVVLGADRTWGGYFNINIQYLVRWVDGFGNGVPADPYSGGTAALLDRMSQQQRELQHGVTLRVADQWRQETVAADVSIVALLGPRQVLVRPSLSYALSDRWKLLVGADVYDGMPGSQFRDLRRNSLGYLEVRLGLP